MAIELPYIGVTTETSTQSSPSNQSVSSGQFQLAGITQRGPLNHPTVVRSVKEYQAIFGARTPYETLLDSVRLFFQEGGAELWVTRVVGPAATNGSSTLRTAGETPVDAVQIEVVDPGAHSTDYRAVVSNNTDGTFNLTVLDSVTNRILASFPRTDSAQDLVRQASNNDTVIVRDLGATGALAVGSFNFTAGSDDRNSITAVHYVNALDAHKGVRSGIAVAIPGQPATLVADGLGEHCKNHEKIGLLEVAIGATIDEAKALGESLASNSYGSYLSKPFYPAIRVPDGSDRTRTTSPVGYVAAHRAVTHSALSFAAAVAGPRTKTLWNFAPVSKLNEEDINGLNQSGINGIQSDDGVPYLNNWSSLSNEPGLMDLNVRDTLNNLSVLVKSRLRRFTWVANDGRSLVRAQIESEIDGIMAPLVSGGWLFPSRDGDGNYTDNGYVVTVEDISTSNQSAPYSRITVDLGIKLSPTIRHTHVPIRNINLRNNLQGA